MAISEIIDSFTRDENSVRISMRAESLELGNEKPSSVTLYVSGISGSKIVNMGMGFSFSIRKFLRFLQKMEKDKKLLVRKTKTKDGKVLYLIDSLTDDLFHATITVEVEENAA